MTESREVSKKDKVLTEGFLTWLAEEQSMSAEDFQSLDYSLQVEYLLAFDMDTDEDDE